MSNSRGFAPHFSRNLNLGRDSGRGRRADKIIYANTAISRWFAVGLDDQHQFPPHVSLESITVESVQHRGGDKRFILVNKHPSQESDELVAKKHLNNPWEVISAAVLDDLLSSFRILRTEVDAQGLELIKKPSLVARFGKILFRESPSLKLEGLERDQLENALTSSKRSLHTSLPSSYVDSITSEVVPVIGLDFQEQKELYYVKLSDTRHPTETLSCKCTLGEDKKLRLHKVELNPVRQMVMDISCLDKEVDIRLMLVCKKILKALTDDEMKTILDLIDSAVLDSEVKGGLKWPLGKKHSGDNRYSVIGVWHAVHKAYRNESLRLKVRDVDRFDFMKGTGEAAKEAFFKMKGEQEVDSEHVCSLLTHNLRLIWLQFLSCEKFP
ncbi:hypothetical protein LINGRAHAP2_LOCUS17772 [Linum grandiflorum]